jgi:DNA-binding transcriptional ArsR family regulator
MTESQEELKAKIVKRPLAFEVLRQIGQEKSPTLTSLAQRLGRTPPTIHEVLAMLEKERLIEGEKTGRERVYKIADKNSFRTLTSDPEIRGQINQSLYRLQGEPVFLMNDFAVALGKQLKLLGVEVLENASVNTPLGPIELDFALESQNGKKAGVEVKRIRYPKHIQDELSDEFGRLRAILKSATQFDQVLLILLLPRDKSNVDFDEWAYKDMIEQESTESTRVEVIMEHADDQDIQKPSFVKWLAREIVEHRGKPSRNM